MRQRGNGMSQTKIDSERCLTPKRPAAGGARQPATAILIIGPGDTRRLSRPYNPKPFWKEPKNRDHLRWNQRSSAFHFPG
jgi:hypothetical protein